MNGINVHSISPPMIPLSPISLSSTLHPPPLRPLQWTMEEKKGVEKEKKKVNKGGKGGQVGKRMPAGRKMAPARPSTSGSSHDDDEGEEQAGESQVYHNYSGVNFCEEKPVT